jgi:hypothetical protein
MSLRRLLPVLLAGAAPLLGFAQQDAPPVNIQAILQELARIEESQKNAVVSARQSAIAQIRAAAASPSAATDLYERAVEATQFEGTKNKGAAFADWKASRAPVLRNRELQTALLLHLRYLALSLERKVSEKPDSFVAPSLSYARDLAAAEGQFLKVLEALQNPTGSDRDQQNIDREALKMKDEFLGKALGDSVFVRWLRLGPELPKGDNWELTPGNLSGILEKNVRVPLRAAKNPELLSTYEMELQVLADRASLSRREHEANEFNTVVRPRVQLARANDMIDLGQKNRGIAEIFLMVKTYPQHPDFGKWVKRLRELLTPSEPPAPTPATDTPPGT